MGTRLRSEHDRAIGYEEHFSRGLVLIRCILGGSFADGLPRDHCFLAATVRCLIPVARCICARPMPAMAASCRGLRKLPWRLVHLRAIPSDGSPSAAQTIATLR